MEIARWTAVVASPQLGEYAAANACLQAIAERALAAIDSKADPQADFFEGFDASMMSLAAADVIEKDVPIYSEFVGQTKAHETVELRARVEGMLQRIHFREGTAVRRGQLLFSIDPREYQAAVQSARATLAKAESDLAQARQEAGFVAHLAGAVVVGMARLPVRQDDDPRAQPADLPDLVLAAGRDLAVEVVQLFAGGDGLCLRRRPVAGVTVQHSESAECDGDVTVHIREEVGPYDVAVIESTDPAALIDWLRRRPLLHVEDRYVLVHAALAPRWSVAQAAELAAEVEAELRGPRYRRLLERMYGDEPARWRDDLSGYDRWRFVINAMTRLRVCDDEDRMVLEFKGEPGESSEGWTPWFDVKGRASRSHAVICGHWSALGRVIRDDLYALDSGCVWGRALTAIRLEDREVFEVRC